MSVTHSTSSSIEQVFHHFGQRLAALDYAFFKLNLPEHEIALQVDFIVRRRVGISQLRVSTYAPTGTGVSFAEIPLDHLVIGSAALPDRGGLVGDNWLGATKSRGAVDDIVWNLTY